jgi:hypothetical protein
LAPFARALTRFASDRAAPPSFPSDAAASLGVASAAINPCTLAVPGDHHSVVAQQHTAIRSS